MARVKKLSNGGVVKNTGIKVVQPLTKTEKALYSTAEEKYPENWGHEEGFGPQSKRAAERIEMSPRKVPVGKGVASA